jgi:transposase InsO family protein
MPYNYQLQYRPGKDNPAYFMSRHPKPVNSMNETENLAELYANYVCSNAIPKAMTREEVKLETKLDPLLQKVVTAISLNNWTDPTVERYRRFQDELMVCDEVILRGNRIVLPQSLLNRAIELAHLGHQGIVKTKKLLREKVWFPDIDKMVEANVKMCLPCQASTQGTSSPPEPLKPSPLPEKAWTKVAVDFVGPFPTGEYLIVVIDEYSRYPEVEILTTTSAKAAIPKLDAIFSRQGIPEILKSNNGPPFNGEEFKNFANHLGFKHCKITPYWPRANGETERFMKTIEKAIRAATVEGRNWKQAMYTFLRQYRATPHSTISVSPSEALNNRKLKTHLPDPPSTLSKSEKDEEIRSRDEKNKSTMRSYSDKRNRAKPNNITLGDTVLLRQLKLNKLSTPFDPEPFRVVAVKNSMITARSKLRTVTRNSSFFKKIPHRPIHLETSDDKDNLPKTTTRPSQPPLPPLRRYSPQPRQPERYGYANANIA